MMRCLPILILVSLLTLAAGAPAQEGRPEPLALDQEMKAAAVDSILTALDRVYVFPEVAAEKSSRVTVRDEADVVAVGLVRHPQAALLRLAQGVGQRVDVVGVVVQVQRRPGGGRHPEVAHERLGAVVAGADRDPVLVENGADVVGVNAIHHEGQNRRLVSVGTDEPHSRHREDSFDGPTQEL